MSKLRVRLCVYPFAYESLLRQMHPLCTVLGSGGLRMAAMGVRLSSNLVNELMAVRSVP